ncbi:MAG: hypothetical protein HY888_06440 [Deltaproteobacteria bacterium]|nr:hypothetical protein [Deltaproteobacteria bacterium]
MRVFVNGKEITLAKGMTVRHAISALSGAAADSVNWNVSDRWGNSVGLDGALQEGDCITVEKVPCSGAEQLF